MPVLFTTQCKRLLVETKSGYTKQSITFCTQCSLQWAKHRAARWSTISCWRLRRQAYLFGMHQERNERKNNHICHTSTTVSWRMRWRDYSQRGKNCWTRQSCVIDESRWRIRWTSNVSFEAERWPYCLTSFVNQYSPGPYDSQMAV